MTDPQPIQRAVTGLLSVPWVRRRLGEFVGELFAHEETKGHAEAIALRIRGEETKPVK